MDIKLYIGAHKTATTHIQGILESNRSLLNKNNITLSLPSDIRSEWLNLFFQYCDIPDTIKKNKLLETTPQKGIWILSEENFSGTPNDFRFLPGIYPQLITRLKKFKYLFPNANIQIFFSIRSYEKFYRSTYLEVVRNRGYFPFTEYYDKQRFKDNNWVNIVDAFSKVVSESSIYLWRYENFKFILPEILKNLTSIYNTKGLISNYQLENTRPSLSNKTIKKLESLYPLYPALPQEDSKQLIVTLNNSYPANENNGIYQPFNIQECERFKQQYRKDITMIKNKFPDIKFFGEL